MRRIALICALMLPLPALAQPAEPPAKKPSTLGRTDVNDGAQQTARKLNAIRSTPETPADDTAKTGTSAPPPPAALARP